jgi:fructose-1,6-bisphosphatase II
MKHVPKRGSFMGNEPIYNHHLDLIRVTEAGAIAAAEWVGRGAKEDADKAATDAMRDRLNKIDFYATIAIGEGEKDESYGLFEGEKLGFKAGQLDEPECEIAIDPIEGTTPTAKGGYEAMSVLALAGPGNFYRTKAFYMDKIAVGPKVKDVSIDYPPEVNVRLVANALGKAPQHVTVCVMDRPRHNELVETLRKIGCRIKFISDCDVTACIAVCDSDAGIDMYMSIGGAPEAMIAAAAMKCYGGSFQCREWNKDTGNFGEILEIDDLAKGPTMFAATGITDGKLLNGVRFKARGPVTNTIAMRSESNTVRRMTTEHGN